jgi:hypothetical protein
MEEKMSEHYQFIDGLTECTEEDLLLFDECYAKRIPFSAIWQDRDDSAKIVEWDSDWERWLRHQSQLIEYEGYEKHLPWHIYESSFGLEWIDGYNYQQLQGDCCSMGHKNSLKASNLSNMYRTGHPAPEVAASMTYAIARGGGTPRFGNGLNLNPMSKWAAEVGNFLASDFGKYDGGRYVGKYKRGSVQDANALKHQSVVIYLPACTFDYCYAACSAGIGINMGTFAYPIAAVPNGDGVAVPSSWKNGKHSMAIIYGMTINRTRYLYVENSHGAKYGGDKYSGGKKQHGFWINEGFFYRIADSSFRLGRWYCNVGELAK